MVPLGIGIKRMLALVRPLKTNTYIHKRKALQEMWWNNWWQSRVEWVQIRNIVMDIHHSTNTSLVTKRSSSNRKKSRSVRTEILCLKDRKWPAHVSVLTLVSNAWLMTRATRYHKKVWSISTQAWKLWCLQPQISRLYHATGIHPRCFITMRLSHLCILIRCIRQRKINLKW